MIGAMGAKGGLLSKMPGMGNLAGAGGGGFDPSMLMGGGMAAGPVRKEAPKNRAQQKGKRKQARKARKKNRKR
jgi:hypothetical protein